MSTKLVKRRKRGGGETLKTLSVQQQMFLKELLADPAMNVTNAARKAGYSSPARAGNKLVKHPAIAAELGKAIDQRATKLEITAEEVLREIRAIAKFNLQDLYDKKGEPIPLNKLPRDVAAALTDHRIIFRKGKDGKVYPDVNTVQNSKMHALEMLCRHLGIADERMNVNIEHKLQFEFDLLYGTPDDQADPIEARLNNPLVPLKTLEVTPIKKEASDE